MLNDALGLNYALLIKAIIFLIGYIIVEIIFMQIAFRAQNTIVNYAERDVKHDFFSSILQMEYSCSGLQHFYAHAEKPLNKVIERMKQGLSSEAIMAELQTELAVRWRGIGRNDPCPCGSGLKAKNCCWSQRP